MHNKEMSSEYTPSSGRRSSRRGGRSRNGGRSRGPRNRQENSTSSSSVQAPPKKKTFWQKIVSIFTGDSKPAATSRPASSNGTVRSSERPARTERAERPERTEREDRPTGFRKPEIIEVTTPRIYVGNLSFDATESDLSELFNGVGLVQNVEIVTNKHTEKSKGFVLYSLSGHVTHPGQYAGPLGITLRELLEMAGGIRAGHKLDLPVNRDRRDGTGRHTGRTVMHE